MYVPGEELIRQAQKISDDMALRTDVVVRRLHLERELPSLCLCQEDRDGIECRAFERTLAEINGLDTSHHDRQRVYGSGDEEEA